MVASQPIGLFDSGEGGLTVARAVAHLLPSESLVYACDPARFPYGPRPQPQVREFFFEFMEFFRAVHAKLVVVACHTATAAALAASREHFDVPVIGVIEPGARVAAAASRNGRLGVIATQGTVSTRIYPGILKGFRSDLEVFQAACPSLVALAEYGETESPAAREEVESCLGPLLDLGIDTLLLGCTHFPHLRRVLSEIAGPGIVIIDPAEETAREVKDFLEKRGWLNPSPFEGPREFYATGDPERFVSVGSRLWPGIIRSAHKLTLKPGFWESEFEGR